MLSLFYISPDLCQIWLLLDQSSFQWDVLTRAGPAADGKVVNGACSDFSGHFLHSLLLRLKSSNSLTVSITHLGESLAGAASEPSLRDGVFRTKLFL